MANEFLLASGHQPTTRAVTGIPGMKVAKEIQLSSGHQPTTTTTHHPPSTPELEIARDAREIQLSSGHQPTTTTTHI